MFISASEFALHLARTCKSKRQALGLRQSDLAKQCGVAEATIMRFERSGRATLDVFTRVALVLGAADPIAEALNASVRARPQPKTANEFLRSGRSKQRIRVPR